MKKKHPDGCSILVIPYSGEKSISLFIPYKMLKGIFVVLVLLFVGIASATYRYHTLKEKVIDYDKIVLENAQLESQVLNFTEITSRLQEQVAEMKNLDSTIRDMLELDEAQVETFTQNTTLASSASKNTSPDVVLVHNADSLLDGSTQSAISSYIQDNTRYELSDRGSLNRTIVELTENLETLDRVVPQQGESLESLESAVEEHNKLQEATPSLWPAEGRITSYYGYRTSPFGSGYDFHHGVDIGAAYGSPVKATAGGKVKLRSYSYGYGYYMLIDHGMGFSTLYAHLRRFNVKIGQRVERGDVIAYSGNSGNSTGPHLHYEVRIDGKSTNPVAYLP